MAIIVANNLMQYTEKKIDRLTDEKNIRKVYEGKEK